jgi:WD40 repeat protein
MRPRTLVSAAVGLLLVTQAGALPGDADKSADAERIARLIEQLGDDSFDRRVAATRELEAIGKPALGALRQAASSPDLEVQRRAEYLFQAIAVKLNLLQKAAELHRIGWPGVHAFNTAFSPDGRYCLAGGDGGTVRVYEVKSGKQVQELVGHAGYTTQGAFTPDGKQVLSASTDGTLRLWDLATGKEVRQLKGHVGGVASVDLTRDGKWAVSGGDDKTLRLWEVATGKEIRKFEGHKGACMARFSPDGKQVLSSGADRTMRLWDAASGKELRVFEGHTSLLFGAFFLPGGKRALSYSADQTARVWDLATGKEISKLDVGPNLSDIRGLAPAPDGEHILVGEDRTPSVRLVELATGKEVHRFATAAPPRGLSFSPDGRLAASGSWRGFVHVWRIPGIFDLD